MKPKFVICLMCCVCSSTYAAITYNDGGIHSIWDYTDTYVRGSTTVEVRSGANIRALECFDDSKAYIYGGRVGYPNVRLIGYNRSMLRITGGDIYDEIVTYGSSTLDFSGGTLHGGYVRIKDYSTMKMSGGSIIGDLYAESSNGKIDLTGGTISGTLRAVDNGSFTIVGSSFAIDGKPVSSGMYTVSDYSTGRLTGILENGDSLNNAFVISSTANIILIPEPATLSLFALGGLLLRRNNKPML